ncbi:ATP-dependent helicase [Rarobacter incanus]|uniref:DNA 3'-5' helicase n=1 Tax=Rarobacter incanus TaxID=153494 RepID=A0A542SNH4_9MICO|nr:ATP-dependent DNA helicase UvrD2 [Rarobacter incanus]TQK76181.1 Rep family ATP-dependent DNA helicase [Rarobacter incanus]
MSPDEKVAKVPGADQLIDALDPEQREVALAVTGPVCVLAGAGTGKTRAITHRIAYGVRTGRYAPTSVLAVTFTARAASEMRSRLRDLGVPGVQARTFHSAAMRQLGHFWPKVIGGRPWQVVEHKAQLVAAAARSLAMSVDRIAVRDLASQIEWAKVTLVRPDDFAAVVERQSREMPAGFSEQTVARLYSRYEELKTERAVMDFEDVLALTAQMIADHPDVAKTIRSQYKHFVVDEFQDVSPIQHTLLRQWLGNRQELCVVGDPSQTIYSFAGATPSYLMEFKREYPGATVVSLVRDYRSTTAIVGLANSVLERGRKLDPARVKPLKLISQVGRGPAVSFTTYDHDEAEAAGVAARARALISAGERPADIAVLYRTNAQAEALEQAFQEAGVGVVIRGGERFFQRKDVRDATMLLRANVHHAPDRSMPEVVRDILGDVGWSAQAPTAQGAARERWDAMQALVELADALAETRGADMGAYVQELQERAANQHAPTVDGVTLASLHAAKGLEWESVFLIGVSEGLIPISLAETDEAIAEERRLLYVGITRAKRNLELSYAKSRRAGGRGTRKSSRFLDGIWPAPDVSPLAKERRARTSALATGEDVDPQLFERLRQWRADLAKEMSKPAFVILGNISLVEIAQARPTTMAELARIRGIGPTKLEQFGESIVAIVVDHLRA